MIDFEIPDEDRALLESIDRMMARRFPPEALRRADLNHETPWHLLDDMAQMGLLALPFPERYGGLAKDWRSVTVAQERLAQHAGIACTLFSTNVSFGGMSLLTYGSEAQKSELLPRLIAGKARFALALTESGAGSDAGAIVTTARRTDRGWSINGRKVWISNADASDYSGGRMSHRGGIDGVERRVDAAGAARDAGHRHDGSRQGRAPLHALVGHRFR